MRATARIAALVTVTALVGVGLPAATAQEDSRAKAKGWQVGTLASGADVHALGGRREFVHTDSQDGFRYFFTQGGSLRTAQAGTSLRSQTLSEGAVGGVATDDHVVAWYDGGADAVRVKAWAIEGGQGTAATIEGETVAVPGSDQASGESRVAFDATSEVGLLAYSRSGAGGTEVVAHTTSTPSLIPAATAFGTATVVSAAEPGALSDVVVAAPAAGPVVVTRRTLPAGAAEVTVRAATTAGGVATWGTPATVCEAAAGDVAACSDPKVAIDGAGNAHVFFRTAAGLSSVQVSGAQVGAAAVLAPLPEHYAVAGAMSSASPLTLASYAGGTTTVQALTAGGATSTVPTGQVTALDLAHTTRGPVLAWATATDVRAATAAKGRWTTRTVSAQPGVDEIGVTGGRSGSVWFAGPTSAGRTASYAEMDMKGPLSIFEGLVRAKRKGRVSYSYTVEDNWGVARSVIQVRKGASKQSLGPWRKVAVVKHRGATAKRVKRVLRTKRGVVYCVRAKGIDRQGNVGRWSRRSGDDSGMFVSVCIRGK